MSGEESKLKKRIEELENLVEVLETDLIHDKLTGLKTRGFFEQEVKTYFSVASRSSSRETSRRRGWFGFSQISIIFFDIDNFKSINDTLGHQVGDDVLKSVAETIKISVRDGDIAARWGGEELVVALVGASEKDAMYKAEEIRSHVEETRFGKYPDLKVTVSGGVSSANLGLTFEDTVDRADKALYKAKHSGKNRIVSHLSL